MKDIKLLISSILIICAFFLGYLFADQQNNYGGDSNTDENIYVNVQNKGKNITIDSENPNIILLLNGQETSSGSIVLE